MNRSGADSCNRSSTGRQTPRGFTSAVGKDAVKPGDTYLGDVATLLDRGQDVSESRTEGQEVSRKILYLYTIGILFEVTSGHADS
jgi:hypothetical protein